MPISRPHHSALPHLALVLLLAAAAAGLPAVWAARSAAPAFSGRVRLPVGAEPFAIAVADFNDDGLGDIVTADRVDESLSVILALGGGAFAETLHFDTASEPSSLAVADFNEDGHADVVVVHGSFDTGNLSVHLGDGAGGLGPPQTFLVGGTPNHVVVGDFNEDGHADLALPNRTFEGSDIDNVLVLLGTGAATFGAPARFPAGPLPAFIATGDFNEDDHTDLVVSNGRFTADRVSVLLGTGAGAFGAPAQFAVGASPGPVVVADFDEDGHADLAVGNQDSHDISVLLGTGAGAFGAATNFAAGSAFPYSMVAGEYTGDGNLDLAVGFNVVQFSAAISVLAGGGDGTFRAAGSFTVPSGPTKLAGGDLNGDDEDDLATANTQGSTVSVLLSPTVRASIDDPTVVEGDSGVRELTFTVTLSTPNPGPGTITVGYVVEGLTAGPGDFFPAEGTLVIGSGSTGTITVFVVGDRTFEPDETLRVTLSDARNLLIADAEGVGTIANNDPLPTANIGDASVVEGDSGLRDATFTVSLSNPSSEAVDMVVETRDGTATAAGNDYVTAAGQLVFAPGETSKTFSVGVVGDAAAEPNEHFLLAFRTIENAAPGRTGRGVIVNDDPKVNFETGSLTVTEGTDRSATLTVTRSGDLNITTRVSYETVSASAFERSDFTAAFGTLVFAPGEASKTVSVLITDDAYAETAETFKLRLSGPTGGGLGPASEATVTILSDDPADGPSPVKNASFDAEFFVRQHYHDFLGREPEPAGLQFWVGQIAECEQRPAPERQRCREVRRVNVSAAFFLSIEFQETGYLAYRLHKAAFGDLPGLPVPIRLRDFLADARRIGEGVQVGVGDWERRLESNKNALADEFVLRPSFLARYPSLMTAAQFVDALNASAGGPLSQAERDALVADVARGAKTRAQALRAVAEDQTLVRGEFNKAFVLMQYFGYLRRNPDDSPDVNFDGYLFWLGKLNEFNGNFVRAEMVKAFITSIEYERRFGQ